MSRCLRPTARPAAKRAFTLIELLVVVAIIALLISILLPSLKCAREQARAVKCGAHLHGFATSLAAYMGEYNGYVPGVNTSGAAALGRSFGGHMDMSVWEDSSVPVQSFDWMTPLLRYDTELPGKRAERWNFLWQRFRCPSLMRTNSVFYGNYKDKAEFSEFEWPGCSYLMPAYFSYWGKKAGEKSIRLGYDVKYKWEPIYARYHPSAFDNVENTTFRSRELQVGNPSRKVFVADGTRYLDRSGILDFDISPAPGYYGAFTSSGAWWGGSTAYGAPVGSQTYDNGSVSYGGSRNRDGLNLPLSYRHGCQQGGWASAMDNKGAINALFFDGHVERMSDRASREIHLWYPSGSVVKSTSDGMLSVPSRYVIP